MPFLLRRGPADGRRDVSFQERVQQFQSQLKEMEREKERELNALRKERRDLVHTNQTVRPCCCLLVIPLLLLDDNKENSFSACLLHFDKDGDCRH